MNAKKEIWAILGVPDHEEVSFALETLIRIGLAILGADEGSLLLYRKEDNVLEFASNVGGADGGKLIGKTVPLGQGVTGMAALTREVQSATRSEGSLYNVADDGAPNTVLAAPILAEEELVGVITAVSFDRQKAFVSRDCELFGLLATVSAILIRQQQKLTMINSKSAKPTAATEQDRCSAAAAEQIAHFVKKNPAKAEQLCKMLEIINDLV